ncbi:MAG: response regulator [Eubacterium ramulus]
MSKKRLVKEHYSVDACGDGLEAMDHIDMTSYDGIILDIMLPGKDGYEILRELRRQQKMIHRFCATDSKRQH